MRARDALVVDDDPDGRGALAQILEAHGYVVRQAENGRVALDMVAERMPGVLVLDLEMPVMSGWEVLASLERAGALEAITIVVLSGAASPPLGVAFVRKPCGIEELLGMLGAAGPPGEAGSTPTGHP